MKGIIGIVGQETGKYNEFWGDLNNLHAPDGVEIVQQLDGTLGQARNAVVARFLATDAQWLVMIDDDHAIDPEYLRHWLRRHELALNQPVAFPIVASVYLTRGMPFAPTLYGPPDADLRFPTITLDQLPTSGIAPVYAAGASGLFVRRDVYETMPPPWYELGYADVIGEDMSFCHKAQQLGFPVHVDLDSRLGHLAPFAIWPDVINGEWVTSIRRRGFAVVIDAAQPATEAARV